SGSDDTGLPEECFDRGRVGGKRCGVRPGCATTGAREPAVQHYDRFAPTDAPGDPGEPPRVAERFEVKQDHFGLRVVFPVLKKVVTRYVGLVPDTDERGEAQPVALRDAERGEANRPAL